MLKEGTIKTMIHDKEELLEKKKADINMLQGRRNEIDVLLREAVAIHNTALVEITQLKEVLGVKQ